MSFTGPISASILQVLKGWYQLTSLDKSAPFDPTQAASLAEAGVVNVAGRVAVFSTANAGYIALATSGGGRGDVTQNPMPMFLWQGYADLDVATTGTYANKIHWRNTVPAGIVTGLVATGGYELQTTEYNTDGSYNVGRTALTCMAYASNGQNNWGRLTNGAFKTNWVCGVTSLHAQQRWDKQTTAPTTATGTNAHGQSVLTFWTYFLPTFS